MPNLLVIAGLIALFWLFHSNLKWRFIAAIVVGVLFIVFHDQVEPQGAGIIYGIVFVVLGLIWLWVYNSVMKNDKNEDG